MSYDIAMFRPQYPDAKQDNEQMTVLTSFAGPGIPGKDDKKWLQFSIGNLCFRMIPPQILSLMILCEQRLKGTDLPMINLGGNHAIDEH